MEVLHEIQRYLSVYDQVYWRSTSKRFKRLLNKSIIRDTWFRDEAWKTMRMHKELRVRAWMLARGNQMLPRTLTNMNKKGYVRWTTIVKHLNKIAESSGHNGMRSCNIVQHRLKYLAGAMQWLTPEQQLQVCSTIEEMVLERKWKLANRRR